MTHASRNTLTGLAFEEKVSIKSKGIDLTKHKLYKYLASIGINYEDILSRKLLPDEAYYDKDNKILYIYEKKFQQCEGSADEKPQTCGFKIYQFRKIANAIGAEKVYYTYILSDWFKQTKYRDMLDYIKSVPGCDYLFEEDCNGNK